MTSPGTKSSHPRQLKSLNPSLMHTTNVDILYYENISLCFLLHTSASPHPIALPEVVHHVGHVQQVESGESFYPTLSRRVIVIPVDAEDRQPHGKVRVLVVNVPEPFGQKGRGGGGGGEGRKGKKYLRCTWHVAKYFVSLRMQRDVVCYRICCVCMLQKMYRECYTRCNVVCFTEYVLALSQCRSCLLVYYKIYCAHAPANPYNITVYAKGWRVGGGRGRRAAASSEYYTRFQAVAVQH